MLGRLLRSVGYALLRSGRVRSLPPPVRDFAEQGSLMAMLKRHDINCVIDVGAHHGWFSRRLRRSGYTGRIIAFEPIPDNAALIEHWAAGDPKIVVRRFAIGDVAESKTFNVLSTASGGNTMSSFLEPTIGFADRKEIPVEVRRLDDLLDTLLPAGEEARIFLKIDTQGFDMAVMRGAARWLGSIKAIQSELSVIPIYRDMPSYREALALYEDMGFGMVDLLVVNRTSDGRVLEFDCRMARPTN